MNADVAGTSLGGDGERVAHACEQRLDRDGILVVQRGAAFGDMPGDLVKDLAPALQRYAGKGLL